MSRDGSGNYTLPSGNPVVPNTIISSGGWANPTLSDIAAALTQSLSKDGQTVPTANLPMGNFRHINVANAANRTDYAAAGQIQDGGLTTLSSVSGTDTITANSSPAVAAYAAGQCFDFIAAGTNLSSAVTLNINGLGAKNVTKLGTVGLIPGDILNGQSVRVRYDGTQFQITSQIQPGLVLLSSQSASSSASIDFTGFVSSLYTNYVLEFSDYVPSATSNEIWMRLSQSGTFVTSANYTYAWSFATSAPALSSAGAANDTKTQLTNGVNTGSGLGVSGRITLFSPSATSSFKRAIWDLMNANGTSTVRVCGGLSFAPNTNAVDGIRILPASGTIASGVFKLYGERA